MKGLWYVPTRTLDPGLGVVIIDLFAAMAAIIFTAISISRTLKSWRTVWCLHVGMILFSVYSILHWTDQMVRHGQTRLTYDYILTGCFYNSIRIISEIFLLFGIIILLSHYENVPNLEGTIDIPMPVVIIGIMMLLLALAIYQICLSFSLSFAWLAFADLGVINELAKSRSGFEITFTTLQFLCTLIALFFGIWADTHSDLYKHHDAVHDYHTRRLITTWATLTLLLRSFCEVVLVGQLDRTPFDIRMILRGRDVTYSLFSTVFLSLVTFAIPSKSDKHPLTIMRQEAAEDVKTWVLGQLVTLTGGGKRTAPTISSLLDSLESDLRQQIQERDAHRGNTIKTKEDWAARFKIQEIALLRKLYGDWEPIYKWQGKKDKEPKESESIVEEPVMGYAPSYRSDIIQDCRVM